LKKILSKQKIGFQHYKTDRTGNRCFLFISQAFHPDPSSKAFYQAFSNHKGRREIFRRPDTI